jgi:hypothetical protein
MTVPLYLLSDVWSDPSQLYAAIRMNVQDGGHKAGSLLLDLQVNGISQFSIDSNGNVLLLSDLNFMRDNVPPTNFHALALRNGTNPQSLRVYNTYTDDGNYERGGIGWIATSGVLSIGTQAQGSGNLHPVQFIGPNFLIAQADLGIFRAAAGVLEINSGSAGVKTGCYIQWGGTGRATSDFSKNNATLANVPGLTVNVAAGRAYSFEVDLPFTCVAAAGIKCAVVGSATATNIVYDGWIVDAAAAGIKGNAQATALGGVVASAVTTGTAGHVTISGTIEVSAAGTFSVQAAQNTTNATATIIKRGSRMIVHDIT